MKTGGKISECLKKLGTKGKKALIPFITAGDPDLAYTVSLANDLVQAGADIIELGVPFSDPLADGPVIQQASGRALAAGASLSGVLDTVFEIRKTVSTPIILMGYYNPFYRYGLKRFIHDAGRAGVDGLIVPDLPFEESLPMGQAALAGGIDLIPLVAPTTTDRRLEKITSLARGFVYCVSLTGVTGVREHLNTDLADFTGRVRRFTSLPLAVGFGISSPGQAAHAAKHCDAVVVGSAIVKIIAESSFSSGPSVRRLMRSFREALDDIS